MEAGAGQPGVSLCPRCDTRSRGTHGCHVSGCAAAGQRRGAGAGDTAVSVTTGDTRPSRPQGWVRRGQRPEGQGAPGTGNSEKGLEVAGSVQPRGGVTERGPHQCDHVLKGWVSRRWSSLFSVVPSNRARDNGQKLMHRKGSST